MLQGDLGHPVGEDELALEHGGLQGVREARGGRGIVVPVIASEGVAGPALKVLGGGGRELVLEGQEDVRRGGEVLGRIELLAQAHQGAVGERPRPGLVLPGGVVVVHVLVPLVEDGVADGHLGGGHDPGTPLRGAGEHAVAAVVEVAVGAVRPRPQVGDAGEVGLQGGAQEGDRVDGDRRMERFEGEGGHGLGQPVAEAFLVAHREPLQADHAGSRGAGAEALAAHVGAGVVAHGDPGAVVGERPHAGEPQGQALGVVAGEHLLMHVEEDLPLAVLGLGRPGRIGGVRGAAERIDHVPVGVVLVGERVLPVPFEPVAGLRAAHERGVDGGEPRLPLGLLQDVQQLGAGDGARERRVRGGGELGVAHRQRRDDVHQRPAARMVGDEHHQRVVHEVRILPVAHPLVEIEDVLQPLLVGRGVGEAHHLGHQLHGAGEVGPVEGREGLDRLLPRRRQLRRRLPEGGAARRRRLQEQRPGAVTDIGQIGHRGSPPVSEQYDLKAWAFLFDLALRLRGS